MAKAFFDREKLVDLKRWHKAGLTIKEISVEMGCSTEAVRNQLNKLFLTPNGTNPSMRYGARFDKQPEDIYVSNAQFLDAYKTIKTSKGLAKHFKVGEWRIKQIAKDLGKELKTSERESTRIKLNSKMSDFEFSDIISGEILG